MLIFLTHADTDLLTLGRVGPDLQAGMPAVRAANLRELAAPDTLARFIARELDQAILVIVRLLGGRQSFAGGFEQLAQACRARGAAFLPVPGDHESDPELLSWSTVSEDAARAAFRYLLLGGVKNFANLLAYLTNRLLGSTFPCRPPEPLPWDGLYHPEEPAGLTLAEYRRRRFQPDRPTIGVLFYRAHWMSGNLAFVDALIRALESDANVLPVFCYSLKSDLDHGMTSVFQRYLLDAAGQSQIDCLLMTISFSLAAMTSASAEASRMRPAAPLIADEWSATVLDHLNVPIVQALVASSTYAEWSESTRGLGPLDVAMNVAMPEFDGRIITVPISFKETTERHDGLGAALVRYLPVPDRVQFVARLALNWARLRRKPNHEKRLALILTNYPTKNSRIGNAVGLDTPASVIKILHALREAGYRVENIPANGNFLIEELIARGSNDQEFMTAAHWATTAGRVETAQYAEWFGGLSPAVQTAMRDTWGEPPGTVQQINGTLAIAGLQLGNIFVGIQPPRGYGENPAAIFHSPTLIPTHHYLAYYHWLREVFRADVIAHVGKHGTLEWLPGKGIGLSSSCYPEVGLRDIPHFYPYIVNNPGEGTQAKRRAHAVVVDHLIPAMTTADAYGDIARLEQLLDEYYQVQTLDPKKIPLLRQQIWQVIVDTQFHRDLGRDEIPADFDTFLQEMDGYLCELKDAQIRDGLHILGETPTGEQLIGLLLALTRLDSVRAPSLRATLAQAFGLDYRTLLDDRGTALPGSPPAFLVSLQPDVPLRTRGDAIERLALLARRLLLRLQEQQFRSASAHAVVAEILGASVPEVEGILAYIADELYPNLLRTPDEIHNLLRGFSGE